MTGRVQPLPTDTCLVAEEAYKFGVGPILVHSVEVITEVMFCAELWLHVNAWVANGEWQRHGRFVERELYIRADGRWRHHSSHPSP
ncbi:hypothetical protein KRMM14A1004_14410 [Krasilnikovia sp. MM14-A1004]